VESAVSKFPQTLGLEFMWKIWPILQKSKSSRPNMSKKFNAVRSSRFKKGVRILVADEGNWTVVLDESR
jgi:hypothetical protein